MEEGVFGRYQEKPVRRAAHKLLARTGFVPKPLSNGSESKTDTFEVEEINGTTWDYLLEDQTIELDTHLQIALAVVDQSLIFKTLGCLLLDRHPRNIMIKPSTPQNTEWIDRVIQIDLAQAVDLKNNQYYGTNMPFNSNYAEPTLVGQIANSLLRASSLSEEEREKLRLQLQPWCEGIAIKRMGLESLRDFLRNKLGMADSSQENVVLQN